MVSHEAGCVTSPQNAITLWIRLLYIQLPEFTLSNSYASTRAYQFLIMSYLVIYKKMDMIFFALYLALKGDDMHGFRNRQCFSHLTWMYYPEKPQRPWLTYSTVNYVLNIYRPFSPHLNYNFVMYHKCKMDFSAL